MRVKQMVSVVLVCVTLAGSTALGAVGKGFVDKNGIYHCPKPNLVITLGWSGEKVKLPAPIDIHSTVMAGPEGQEWITRGNMCRIHYTNKAGWNYEADALCMSLDAKGRKCPVLSKIAAYRPDGTIAKETTCSPDGAPDSWKVYDEKGRLALEVINRLSGLPGTPFIREVKYYNRDGSFRRLSVNNPQQIVDWETLEADGKEIKTLHYCRGRE